MDHDNVIDAGSEISHVRIARAAHSYLTWMVELGADELISSNPGKLDSDQSERSGHYVSSENRLHDADVAYRGDSSPLLATEPALRSRDSAVADVASVAAHRLSLGQSRGDRVAGISPAGELRPSLTSSAASAEASRAAKAVSSLADLWAAVANFEHCDLKRTAKNTVFSDGNPAAPLMIVGEAPGRDEDIAGKPFVGAAGQLLDKMLAAIKFDRNDVYITNLLYWRPPGNRNPTASEIESVLPFLIRHIELVRPRCVLTMGNIATKALRDDQTGILKARGSWRKLECGGVRVDSLAMFHPAYLLRQPGAKRHAWEDLQAIKRFLSQSSEQIAESETYTDS